MCVKVDESKPWFALGHKNRQNQILFSKPCVPIYFEPHKMTPCTCSSMSAIINRLVIELFSRRHILAQLGNCFVSQTPENNAALTRQHSIYAGLFGQYNFWSPSTKELHCYNSIFWAAPNHLLVPSLNILIFISRNCLKLLPTRRPQRKRRRLPKRLLQQTVPRQLSSSSESPIFEWLFLLSEINENRIFSTSPYFCVVCKSLFSHEFMSK